MDRRFCDGDCFNIELTLGFHGRGLAPAEDDIELVTQRPVGLGSLYRKRSNEALPSGFVRHAIQHWISGKQRVSGKITSASRGG